jgi:hypothetical protein
MNTIKEELREFLKAEFEHAAFMAHLGQQVPRRELFDMFLRTGNDSLWSVIVECLKIDRGE